MIPELAAKTVLFQGCSPQEVEQLYRCLQMTDRDYTRGTPVLLSGSPVTDIGIVLSGSVRIESGDVWGGVSVLGMVEPGGVFAEAYACLPGEPLLVAVIANTDCRILFLTVPRLLQPCGQACGCHNQVIRNLVMAAPGRTCISPSASSTPPPRPSGGGCFPTCPSRRPSKAAAG